MLKVSACKSPIPTMNIKSAPYATLKTHNTIIPCCHLHFIPIDPNLSDHIIHMQALMINQDSFWHALYVVTYLHRQKGTMLGSIVHELPIQCLLNPVKVLYQKAAARQRNAESLSQSIPAHKEINHIHPFPVHIWVPVSFLRKDDKYSGNIVKES